MAGVQHGFRFTTEDTDEEVLRYAQDFGMQLPLLLAPHKRLNLFATARLNFDVDVDERHRCRGDAREAGGMAQGAGADLDEFLLHLAGETADRAIVEPVGNGALFGLLQTLNGALLLVKIAFVLNFGFDRLKFVAQGGRKSCHGFARMFRDLVSFKELGSEFAEKRDQVLDGDFGALEELSTGLADGGRKIDLSG